MKQLTTEAVQENKNESRTILWWATLGLTFLVVQIYVFSAWILSPDFRPTAPVSDPLPAIWLSMGLLDVVATRFFYFDAWPGVERSLSLWGGQFYV